MKKALIILGITLVLVSCQKQDKMAKLEKLKKEYSALGDKIRQLETELAKEGKLHPEQKLRTVQCISLTPAEFNHYIEVQGKVDGEENVAVTAKSVGVLTAIHVKEGDAVKKGQVLAETDAQVLKKSIDELKAQLDFARNIYEKQKNLWDQKIGSEVQYLTAKNNKESLENKLVTLQEQLDMSKIVSPINGTIEEVGVKIGQNVAPGMAAFRVVNFSRVKVTAEIAEAYSAKVKTGNPVLINFPDFNREVNARIDFASKYINPVNRTFIVEVRIAPTDMELRANMISVLKINDYKNPNALIIPVNTIQQSPEGQYVYVVDDKNGKKITHRKIITTGQMYNGNVEVTSGLSQGDQLITAGYLEVTEGQEVLVK